MEPSKLIAAHDAKHHPTTTIQKFLTGIQEVKLQETIVEL